MPHGTPINPHLSGSLMLAVNRHISPPILQPLPTRNSSPSPQPHHVVTSVPNTQQLHYKRDHHSIGPGPVNKEGNADVEHANAAVFTSAVAPVPYGQPSHSATIQRSQALAHHRMLAHSQPMQIAAGAGVHGRSEYLEAGVRVAAGPPPGMYSTGQRAISPTQHQQQQMTPSNYPMREATQPVTSKSGPSLQASGARGRLGEDNTSKRGLPLGQEISQGGGIPVDPGIAPKAEDQLGTVAHGMYADEGSDVRQIPHAMALASSAMQTAEHGGDILQLNDSQRTDYRQAQQMRPQPPGKLDGDVSRDGEGEGRRQLKVEDALLYLEKVKLVFGEQPDVYNLFLDIMKAFKAQTIDTTEVIVRVSQLFQGHEALILGFNRFLPPGYKILIGEDEKGGVSTGFEGPKGYSSLPTAHPSLQLKPIAPHPPVDHPDSVHNVHAPHAATADSKLNPPAVVNSNAAHPAPTAQTVSNVDVSDPQPRAPPSPAATPDRLSERANPAPPSPRSPVQNSVASPLPTATATMHDGDLNMPDSVPSPTLPTGSIPGPLEATDEEKSRGFGEALNFLNNISRRSSNPVLFQRFVEITGTFSSGEKSVREFYSAVSDLFDDHRDLLQQFKQFLPLFYTPTTNGNLNSTRNVDLRQSSSTVRRRAKLPKGEVAVFNNIRDTLGRPRSHIYNDFIKVVRLFSIEIITKDELLAIINELFKSCPVVNTIFINYLEAAANDDGNEEDDDDDTDSEVMKTDVTQLGTADVSRTERYRERCVSEIAAESNVFCNASYRGLPKDFPQPICSGRSALEKATLNNNWVSVTHGSEEYSTRFMRKNTFEDNLYRCEDDRYELDMIIETNASTIMKLEPIAATITKLPSEVKAMHALVDGVLNRIHYNAIQRIYGEKGQEVVMQVKLNPYVAIPVVLTRLKEKDAHWRRSRSQMNLVWRDVGEKNYYKGVDHRSSVFKQIDKKELSTRTLLLDLMDPAASATARDTELARARGYAVQTGGAGVVNDRSRALSGVIKAGLQGSPPNVLLLAYEDDAIHRVAFELVRMQVLKEVHDSAAARFILRTFRKLITSFYGVSVEEDESAGGSSSSSRSKELFDMPVVLYGDETIYCMFRLYDILYERLLMAKTEAFKRAADQKKRNEMNEKGQKRIEGNSHIPDLETKPNSLVQNFTSSAQKPFTVKKLPTDGKTLFSDFISLFRTTISSRGFNTELYEDQCRVLLGPKCFVLFTLDKVLSKTLSHVLKCCGTESPSRSFIDIYIDWRTRLRSSSRSLNGEHWEGFELLYCTASTALLRKEKGTGATLFRLRYVRRTSNSNGVLSLAACGRTLNDDEERLRLANAAQLDAFLGFSGSTDASPLKTKKSDNGVPPSLSAAAGSADAESKKVESERSNKKRKSSLSGHPVRKRSRTTAKPRPPFLRKDIVREKVQNKSFKIANSLAMKIKRNGTQTFVPGGSDILLNRDRWWNFDRNAKPITATRFARNKIAQMFLPKEGMNEEPKADTDKPMDVDRTESSSGSGTHSDMDSGAIKGVAAAAPIDEEVAGETCSESSRKDESGEEAGDAQMHFAGDGEEMNDSGVVLKEEQLEMGTDDLKTKSGLDTRENDSKEKEMYNEPGQHVPETSVEMKNSNVGK